MEYETLNQQILKYLGYAFIAKTSYDFIIYELSYI